MNTPLRMFRSIFRWINYEKKQEAQDTEEATSSIGSQDKIFKHTRLDLRYAEIRLLRLRARAASGEPIRCSLKIFKFDDSDLPPYIAVSYAWGTDKHKIAIFIDGQSYQVSQNLGQFLDFYTRAELRTGVDYLWIDQLCIDQTSTLERNHQVKLMSQIYSGAKQVLSWLGIASNGSNDVIERIHEAARPALDHNFGTKHSMPKTESLMLKKGTSKRKISCFFQRDYWHRLWVAQEVILAKKWTIFCGSKQLNERALQFVIYKLWSGSSLSSALRPARWIREKEWRRLRGSDVRQQSEVLRFLCHLECQDPRDKIYGLQALVAVHERVPINYDLPAAEVFWLAMAHFGPWEDKYSESFRLCIRKLGYDMGVVGREENYKGVVRELFKAFFPKSEPEEIFSTPPAAHLWKYGCY